MANPLANQTITNSIGYAYEIAKILGLFNWQMGEGSYNGVNFHLVTSGILANLNQYNPLAGTISTISGLISRPNTIAGTLLETNEDLPYGTSTVSREIIEQGNKKYARHRIPNSQFNVLEDLGWDGEVIRCVGLIFGSSALRANNNIFNAMINSEAIPIVDRYVLVHPIFGTIQNVLLTSYKRIHSSEKYKAIAYELVFETSQPIQAITKPPSVQSIIATAFSAIVGAYNGINSAINLGYTLFYAGKNFIDSAFQTNYNNAQVNSASLVGVSQLMYTNLKPPAIIVPSLSSINASTVNLSTGSKNITVTTSNQSSSQKTITPTTNVVNVNLSAYNTVFNTGLINGVTQVIALYAQNVANMIQTIVNSGQQDVWQSAILAFEAGIVALNAVGQALLSNIAQNTTTVIIQNNTTLEELFFKYNINFNNSSNIQQTISLNPGVFSSVNFLAQGTKMVIPNDLSS
jgi:hypothetical protein